MAVIHNQTGSLESLISKFSFEGIHSFNSLKDINDFNKNYDEELESIQQESQDKLNEEIKQLETECKKLSDELKPKIKYRESLYRQKLRNIKFRINNLKESHFLFFNIPNLFKYIKLVNQKQILSANIEDLIKEPYQDMVEKLDSLAKELEDKKNNKEKWINLYTETKTNKFKLVKSIININQPLYLGAIGEEKALKELQKLPDEYVIINNYYREFSKPIHDKKNHDWIYSIQIDHVVVGPTGLFFIETKNWSKESINNEDLFSPVQQIKRSSYAMFIILNEAVEWGNLSSFKNDWGPEKISPRNIILFMNHKPNQEFQFVKLLSLTELKGYITYGNKKFTKEQIGELERFFNKNY